MNRRLRLRYLMECVLGTITGLMMTLTLFVPAWIERLGGDGLDGGTGEAEWQLVVALAIATVVFAALARRDRVTLRSERRFYADR